MALPSFSSVGKFIFALAVITCLALTNVNAQNFDYVTNPPLHLAFADPANASAFPTPSQCIAAAGFACYTPALIKTAYNFPATLDGTGQTIVIVDAYGSPTVREDLHTFDLIFGLPDPQLNIIYPGGKPVFNPLQHHNQVSWAAETSLDVQWAHAIAPKATINLVIAANNGGNVLNNAIRYAIDHNLGKIMSLSFGAPEGAINGKGNNLQVMQAHDNFLAATAAGISVFVSSGDAGGNNLLSFTNASYPASDPLVTSVGGTNLFMSDSGAYQSEDVWNDSDACPFGCVAGPFGATGGSPSLIFPNRSTSDVGYNAGVYTAILVHLGFLGKNSGWYFIGGTSEGSPQWAAIAALANQAKGQALGFLNPKLYAIASNSTKYSADFHDVTVGDDGFFGPGFSAKTGYDFPTGLGTPNVTNLINDLIK